MKILESIVAVDGVCAWPNLTLLPDGTILAVIWNQPCHGRWEGDLDCWASTDGGRSWTRRGQVSQHEPGTNRMNCAVGPAANGDLLVLVSGWSGRDVVGKPRATHGVGHTLQAWAYRSGDGGNTWRKIGELPDSGQQHAYTPFGDIHRAQDGALCASAYNPSDRQQQQAFVFRSYDDGQSWGDQTLLHSPGNETAILPLGEGHWIAAVRTVGALTGMRLELVMSSDDGRSWETKEALTQRSQAPGHLTRLRDGRVLLSYGNRSEGEYGVEARFSEDEGRTWSTPLRLAAMPAKDGGYPSSVERADGAIVTAFYAKHPERGDYQYEMDVVIWQP